MSAVITLATWNLRWRFGDWRARRDLILEDLATTGADIIGLQEVWEQDGANLAGWLADQLGLHCCFYSSPSPEKWQRKIGDNTLGIGNAVLSRWPITESASIPLPAGDAPDEGRMALYARVNTPFGTLPFFTTHLNSGWAQTTIRAAQLAETGHFAMSRSPGDFPVVLCGDFNADPDFEEVRALSGKAAPLVEGLHLLDSWWVLNPTDPGWSWDRTNPDVCSVHEPSARIDYFFVGYPHGDKGQLVAAQLFGNQPRHAVWPSDHAGVRLTIKAGDPTTREA